MKKLRPKPTPRLEGWHLPGDGIQLALEGLLPLTINELLRAHWRKRKKDLDAWIKIVLCLAGYGPWRRGPDGAKSAAAPEPRRIRIHVQRARLQDEDNLRGSVKPVIDAVKRAGWLYDDSTEWLEQRVTEAARKPHGTWIKVERIVKEA